LQAAESLNSTGAATSVCTALSMATVEHSFLCRDTELCMKVAKMSREDISQLHAINLLDVVLESASSLALVLCVFEKLGGARTGGPLLLLFLVADVALEIIAISYATNIQPTIDLILSSECLDVNQADGLGTRDILNNIHSDLSNVVSMGVAELAVAGVAILYDLYEQYREHVARSEKMTDFNRFFWLFLPAIADVILAYFDFFIFTTSANNDAKLLRRSILSNIGPPTTWCVGLTDACVPIIEEDADRFGGQRPGESNYTAMLIVFSVCLGLVVAVYLVLVALYLKYWKHNEEEKDSDRKLREYREALAREAAEAREKREAKKREKREAAQAQREAASRPDVSFEVRGATL